MYNIAAGIARLESGQSAMVDRFEALEKRLFGNGQPGELHNLEAKLEKRMDTLGGRIRMLEKFKWALSGAGMVFSLVGTLVGALIEMFLRK